MIYTITFNPSIDHIVFVEDISTHKVNRASSEYIVPGGKGINVSRVLTSLGVDNIATGFIAGKTGQLIIDFVKTYGVNTAFVELSLGNSRINTKLKTSTGDEIEVNGVGPNIRKEDYNKLLDLLNTLKSGDYLVLAGSVTPGIEDTIYADLVNYANSRGARCIVDASGDLLKNAIPSKPFLIKPNLQELSDIVKKELSTLDDIIDAGKLLQLSGGAENVLISLADKGAVLLTQDEIYTNEAPKGQVINSVGAGDSMVAGFLYGFIESGDYKKALQYGICAGSATAFSIDLASKEDFDNLLN